MCIVGQSTCRQGSLVSPPELVQGPPTGDAARCKPSPALVAFTPPCPPMQELDALAEKFVADVKAGRCAALWRYSACT